LINIQKILTNLFLDVNLFYMETAISKNKAEYFLNNRASLLPRNLSLSSRNSFTLVELIIVVIIVGILASLGLTQYSSVVEKSRTAEAKVRIGTMKTLAYQFHLENGSFTSITNADVDVDHTCRSTDWFNYWVYGYADHVDLIAGRCTSGGKTPNASSAYYIYGAYYSTTGATIWTCFDADWVPHSGPGPC
jgi:prepilin-type N-terminal cleavage/methylation domain-containing protein